jgi:hypothetical protein
VLNSFVRFKFPLWFTQINGIHLNIYNIYQNFVKIIFMGCFIVFILGAFSIRINIKIDFRKNFEKKTFKFIV